MLGSNFKSAIVYLSKNGFPLFLFSSLEGDTLPIEWNKVHDVGTDVAVDLDAENTPALSYEHWLRQHLISRIPGGK